MVAQTTPSTVQTLTLDEFWAWLPRHLGCIVRAGSADTVLYDFEDYHWQVGMESDGRLLLQMLRGKALVGELILGASDVTMVQVQPTERDDEWFFDLCNAQGQVVYYLVMSHSYEDSSDVESISWN